MRPKCRCPWARHRTGLTGKTVADAPDCNLPQAAPSPRTRPLARRIGFQMLFFLPHGAPNTAPDACVSVFEGGARLLSFGSAAENRPLGGSCGLSLIVSPLPSVPRTLPRSRPQRPGSPGRLNGHSWAASGPLQGASGQWPDPLPGSNSPLDCLCPGSACSARPRAGARGGARACFSQVSEDLLDDRLPGRGGPGVRQA